MQIPVTIAFEGLTASDAVQRAVWRHGGKLERYFNRVTSCRVVISRPQHGGRRGDLYCVRVDVTVPGEEIVVNREHRYDHAHEDVYVAVRDAFRAARRRLEDHARRVRFQVKAHAGPERARGAKAVAGAGPGFNGTTDVREVHLHTHGLTGADFSRMRTEVPGRSADAPGERGSRAAVAQAGVRGTVPTGPEVAR